MKWQGCLACPHGQTSSALVASVFAAAGTSCYACLSCTLVNIEFTSAEGDFEEMYSNAGDEGDTALPYSVLAGLFSWLDRDRGICRGYTQSQIALFGDTILQASRFLSVFVVILSLFASAWALSFLCLSYGHCRMFALCLLLFLQCILVCLLFLLKQSALCNDLGEDTSCSLDEGGLVAIAAAILWFVSFCVTFFFVEAIPDYAGPTTTQLVVGEKERRSNRVKERESDRKKRIARKIAAEQESERIEEDKRKYRQRERVRQPPCVPGAVRVSSSKRKNEPRTPDTYHTISPSNHGEVEALYSQRVRSLSPVESQKRLSQRLRQAVSIRSNRPAPELSRNSHRAETAPAQVVGHDGEMEVRFNRSSTALDGMADI